MSLFDFLSNINEFLRSASVQWKSTIATFMIVHASFDLIINLLEYRVQCRKSPSPAVTKLIDVNHDEFKKSQDYQKAKLRLSMFSDIYEAIINYYVLRCNVFSRLWYFFQPFVSQKLPSRYFGDGTVSILAILTFGLISGVLTTPLGLYSTFVIEESFGFNKMTLALYFKDKLKAGLLSSVLMPPILLAIQWIIEYTGKNFVLYIGGLVVVISLAGQILGPTVIFPLFNKYVPLEDGELRTKINNLAERLKFPLKRLYVEDGSTRSAHSNAYFIGLPWYKQIVIFDTLIKQQSPDQIVAVLAHELGHWKHTHIPILMFTGVLQTLLVFAPLSFFLGNKHFFQSLGFNRGPEMPTLAAVALFGDLLTPLTLTLSFFTNYITRLCEYDADKFAVSLGYGDLLSRSLVDLTKENFSALDQHPLYSTYHNSHPLVTERLTAIRESIKKNE